HYGPDILGAQVGWARPCRVPRHNSLVCSTTSQGSHRWILGPIRPGQRSNKSWGGPQIEGRKESGSPMYGYYRTYEPLPSGFLSEDMGSAVKGSVNLCQRPLVNEVLGSLVTKFIRNFRREDATPYQRSSNASLFGRVHAVKLIRHGALPDILSRLHP